MLETNDAGVFRGIAVVDDAGDDVLARTRAIAERVASVLAADGYRGVYGVDGFSYRTGAGQRRVYAMCEINARMSFGVLVHLLAREYRAPGLRLCIDQGPLPEASAHVIPLLAPASDDRTCAWLAASAPIATGQ